MRAIGAAQTRIGNYAMAESYYRRALALSGGSAPSDSSAHQDLAYLLLLSHDPVKLNEPVARPPRS